MQAYIWVSDDDALVAEFKERGANIVDRLQPRKYKRYEMAARDRSGGARYIPKVQASVVK